MHADFKFALFQIGRQFLGHNHRAVASTRAADRDRQITFSFLRVIRERFSDDIEKLLPEPLRLRRRQNITPHGCVTPRFIFEVQILQDIVGIVRA